jgi:hypothetical protein
MSVRKILLCGFRSSLLIVAALVVTPQAFSQAVPVYPPTWDIFGGGSYNESFSPSDHEFGWDASVSERPYAIHPWIGGTIEASGAYTSSSAAASSSQFYTVMAGPTFVLPESRIRPFARVLLGSAIQRTSTTGGETNTEHFGLALGGGVDVPFSRFWSVRGQADWVRSYLSANDTSNMLRASAGFVLRF